jgi:hypothetical protein
MRPLTIIVLASAFVWLGSGLPMTPFVPVTVGIVVAASVAGWALLRRRRPHAFLAFPALAVAAALLTVGPIDVSVNRQAGLGARIVSVLYGMPGPELFERGNAGEVDLRGCIVPRFPKSYAIRIGLNPFG